MCSSWDVLCKPATIRRPFFRPLVRPASSDGRASRLASSSMNNHQRRWVRSEEHTSELQSLMRISYAVFCLKKKKHITTDYNINQFLPSTQPKLTQITL